VKGPFYILFRFLLHSNLIIASAAVSLSLASLVQAGYLPHFQPLHLLIFAGSLSEYNLHRLLKYYSLNRSERKERYPWMFSNLPLAWLLFLFPLPAFAISFFYVDPLTKWIVLAAGTVVLLYSLPLKGPAGLLSLRKIPFLKTFLVALVWSVLTVVVPLAGHSVEITEEMMLWFFIERFFIIFTLALLFDIRDENQDRSNGLRTIPVAFGERKTRRLVVFLLVTFLLTSRVAAGLGGIYTHFIPAIIWSIPVLWFINRKPGSGNSLYYFLLLDGSLILYSFLAIAGGYIFNHLLPFQ
jgi:4-hydroxybenzoate polyprenyltransferase